MKKYGFIFLLALFTSCSFFSTVKEYKLISKEFIETLIDGDYDKIITFIDLPDTLSDNTINDYKNNLKEIGVFLDTNFTSAAKIKFTKFQKTYSTSDDSREIKLLFEMSEADKFVDILLVFDATTGKIISFETTNVHPKPKMLLFWLLVIIGLLVPVFNIYVIIKVRKSSLKRKGLAYVLIFILNFPTFIYSPITGLSVNLLQLQILLGFGFRYMGYLNTVVSIGVPIGGLYYFFKLRKMKKLENKEGLGE